jgi:hypothetical protein
VCWNKKNKRWQAAINSGGKYIYLGSFTSEGDAARQFDRAAIKIRGKKAKLNFTYAGVACCASILLWFGLLSLSSARAVLQLCAKTSEVPGLLRSSCACWCVVMLGVKLQCYCLLFLQALPPFPNWT